MASAANVNWAADRFGIRVASGPDGRPTPGIPYSQSETRTLPPPTTAVQRIALANARRPSSTLRPVTTAIAWSIPKPTIVAASCE